MAIASFLGTLSPGVRPESVEPASFQQMIHLSPARLESLDIARMNMLCAEGLPGAGRLNVNRSLAALDQMAARVKDETIRHLYRFRRNPSEFEHSEAYFRMLMMAVVLAEDFGVRYAPGKRGTILEARVGDGFFASGKKKDAVRAYQQAIALDSEKTILNDKLARAQEE